MTRTFTIITTYANEMMAELHDRVPVILELEVWRGWPSSYAGSGWRYALECLHTEAGAERDALRDCGKIDELRVLRDHSQRASGFVILRTRSGRRSIGLRIEARMSAR